MNRPEILLIPVLMISDYLLTIVGARIRDRGYGKYFKIEQYELNPLFRKETSQQKWMSPRHLMGVVVISLILFQFQRDPVFFYFDGFLGFCLVFFTTILGRHLSNILYFYWVLKNPQEISGTLEMSHRLTLIFSVTALIPPFLLVLLIGIFSPSQFVMGGALAIPATWLQHLIWYFRGTTRPKRRSREKGLLPP